MRMSDMEDWGLALTLVFAVSFAATIHHAKPAAAPASAVALSDQVPQYAMTITAKRLPVMCKGASAVTNAVYCASFLQADAVVEMHETAASFAERTGAVDAAVVFNR